MAGFKPHEEKAGFGDAQQKGKTTSHESTQTAAAAPSPEPHVETPEEKAARRKEERRKKRHAEASAKRREERHRKKAEKKNIALNQEALGVSIAPDINMSVAPCTSLTGAGDGSVGPLSESQDEPVKIGISVYYSLYEEDIINQKPMGDMINESGAGDMNLHDEAITEGNPVSSYVDKMLYYYVDCSDCLFNIDQEKIDDPEGKQKCLQKGLTSILLACHEYGQSGSCTIYLNIGGYDLTKDFIVITKQILTGEMPSEPIEDLELLGFALQNFSSQFNSLKFKGSSFQVMYTCYYKAFLAFGEGKASQKKEKEKTWGDYVLDAMTIPAPGAAGTQSYLIAHGVIKPMGLSEGLHTLFGVGSLLFFLPGVAIACTALDLALHAVECGIAFKNHDRKGAIEHMKGATMDAFFLLPFAKIFKGGQKLLGYGEKAALYAGEKAVAEGETIYRGIKFKLATRSERIATEGAAKQADLLNAASNRTIKMKHLESSSQFFTEESAKLTTKQEKLTGTIAELDGKIAASDSKIRTLEEYSKTVEIEEARVAVLQDIAAEKATNAAMRGQLGVAKTEFARNEKILGYLEEQQQVIAREHSIANQEAGTFLKEANKYNASKYNTAEAAARREAAEQQYILHKQFGFGVIKYNTDRYIETSALVRTMKQIWQADKFAKFREGAVKYGGYAKDTVGEIYTGYGVGSTINSAGFTYDETQNTVSVSNDDFTFIEILQEVPSSIGDDFVNIGKGIGKVLAKPFVAFSEAMGYDDEYYEEMCRTHGEYCPPGVSGGAR